MYQPRAISFLERWQPSSQWALKLYGISADDQMPSAEMIAVAKQLAINEALPQANNHYGAGYIGIHKGLDAHFIFVDWWENQNELHHHVFVASPDTALKFKNKTATGVTACVWDLYLMAYERQAWIDTVLATGDFKNIEAYLNQQLSTVV